MTSCYSSNSMYLLLYCYIIVYCFVGIALSFTESSYIIMEGKRSVKSKLILSDKLNCFCTISVWLDIKEITAKSEYIIIS